MSHTLDIIYLDIEMKSMNRLEAGKKIRNIMHNHKMGIVYISGKDGYDRKLFDCTAPALYYKTY